MKYLLDTLLAGTVVLSACQKDETASTATQPSELSFNLSMEGMPITETRAANQDAKLTDYGFYLAGYHTEGAIESVKTTASPNIFDHDINDRQAAVPLVTMVSNKFTLKTIKWALDNKTYLSFYGWSQNKVIPTTNITDTTYGIIGQTKDASNKGYPWIDIHNANNPKDQTDIVGARSFDHRNDAVLSAVDLDFRHLLSKLTFKAKSSSGATVIIEDLVLRYTPNKVYKKARYTFGSSPSVIGSYGAYAEYQEGNHSLADTKTPITSTGGVEISIDEMLLIPQAIAKGDVTLGIYYKISPDGTLEGKQQHMELPLEAITLEQGKNYVYTIDVRATEIIIDPHPLVEPWNTVNNLPLVAGPKGDVLLELDGYDKPYKHTDGKYYWLDRSGYNRHVQLDGMTEADYDDVGKYYTFAIGKSGKIPSLGTVTDLSLQILAEPTDGAASDLFMFSPKSTLTGDGAERYFFSNIGYTSTGTIYFDTGGDVVENAGRMSYVYSSNDAAGWAALSKPSVWTYVSSNSPNELRLYVDNVPLKQVQMSKTNRLNSGGPLITNRLARNFAGNIRYVKITRTALPQATIATSSDALYTRFKVTKGAKYLSLQPPVTQDLLACFDARSGLTGSNNGATWADVITKKLVTAVVPSGVGASVTYDATNQAIVCAGPVYSATGTRMNGTFNLGSYNAVTVESIYESAPDAYLNFLLEIRNPDKTISSLHMRPNTGGSQGVEFGIMSSAYKYYYDLGPDSKKKGSTVYTINRQNGTLILYRNTLVKANATDVPITSDKLDLSYVIIGNTENSSTKDRQAFTGNIHAIRIYGRELTAAEIQANYIKDKIVFNLP